MRTVTTIIDIEAPPVCFEPCWTFHDEAGAVCEGCGWLVEDHRGDGLGLPTAA